MVLIDSKSKINLINPGYAAKLGLKVQTTKVSAEN